MRDARCLLASLTPLLLLIGTSAGIAQDKPEKEEKPKKETLVIKPAPFKVTVDLTGVFMSEGLEEVLLRPEAWSSLKVDKVVDAGTRVKKGEPILWLETRKIDQELRDLEFQRELGYLSIKSAEAELAALEKTVPLDLEEAVRTDRIAREDLDFYTQVNEQLRRKSAEESLKSSRYSLEYAQEELDQLEQMYTADDLTEETEEIILKRAKRSVEQGQFYLESARIRHDRTLEVELPRERHQVQHAATLAALSLTKAQATLPTALQRKKIELEKLVFSQEQLDEKLEQTRADRELLTVKAPASGIVYYGQNDRGKWTTASTLAKQLRPGGVLAPNTVLMTIVPEAGPMVLRADLPESDIRLVTRETEGTIEPKAYPDVPLDCIVTEVSLIPISDGVYEVFLDYKPSDDAPLLLTGMSGNVELVAYRRESAIVVPSSAVFEDEADGSRYVYLEDAGEAQADRAGGPEVRRQDGDQGWARQGGRDPAQETRVTAGC